jgi:hypothetical protein
MPKQSKRYGKRTVLYDDNPERRERSPDWTFTETFLEKLKANAKKNNVTISCYFESVVINFFILEDPRIIIHSKRGYGSDKKKKAPRMTLHPRIIKEIKRHSKHSPSTSKYIEHIFSLYHSKYGSEIDFANLINLM